MFLLLLINFHGLFEWLAFVDGLHLYFYLFVKNAGGRTTCMYAKYLNVICWFLCYACHAFIYFCCSCQSGWQCFPPNGDTANVWSYPSSNMSPFWNQSTMWRPFPWQPFFNDNFQESVRTPSPDASEEKQNQIQYGSVLIAQWILPNRMVFPRNWHGMLYITYITLPLNRRYAVLFVWARVHPSPTEPSCGFPEGFRATGRCGRPLQILVLATPRRSIADSRWRVDLQFRFGQFP